MSDFLRHLPGAVAPIFRNSAPRTAPPEQVEYIKSAAELHARYREQERAAAARAEVAVSVQPDIAPEAVTPPPPVPAPRSPQQEIPMAKPQTSPPVLSHEQRCAERALFRQGCNWLHLHLLCANACCRKSGGCRGEPVACFRAAMPKVPETARQFVRAMIEGQELGFDFDEAFEDAEEFQESWAAWIAGLQAASKARNRVKKARKWALDQKMISLIP